MKGSKFKLSALKIALVCAVVHLCFVALGAFGTVFPNENSIGRAIGFYGAASGAGNSYGFFAPGIFSQIRAVFEVTDANGVTRTLPLETKISHEADLRVGNIIEQFASDFDDPIEFQRSLAASLAATMLGRDANARAVNVRIERYTPASMTEYQRGARSLWMPEYSAKFVYRRPVVQR